MGNKMFWGCSIPARIPFVESATRKIMDKLGIITEDMENTTCCPDPTGLSSMDHTTWLTLGARNLSLVNKDDVIVSPCSGCVETLKTANYMLKEDEEAKEKIKANLSKIGKEYGGDVKVRHLVELLYDIKDQIKGSVTKPLEGFKVAVHYGCHFLRPSHIINYDDPLAPVTMDELVEVLGGESVDYTRKLDCCGCPVNKSDQEISNEVTFNKLNSINNAGANCIVVCCPACFTQLDFQQRILNKEKGTEFEIPVFYITELIALALGIDPKETGMRFHGTKTKKFFQDTKFITS
ncbi:MAG: CoB--CoM heterodisulfide reductase iron-sulfur subunit B family protein [Promethearchaeota archaeon]